MFDHTHYVPILKWKMGEYSALREMTESQKGRVIPLVEVEPLPIDFDSDVPTRSVAEHLGRIPAKMKQNWGSEDRIFVDTRYVADHANLRDDERKAILEFHSSLRTDHGVKAVPVVTIGSDAALTGQLRSVFADRGACLRLDPEDIDEDLTENINQVLEEMEVAPTGVDLVIDFQYVSADQAPLLTTMVKTVLRTLPFVHEWPSLTVTMSAFPVDLSGQKTTMANRIPRVGWDVYTSILAGSLPRIPTFGDYGVAHPFYPEPIDPRLMNMSASIRYTAEDEWIVLKGRGVRTDRTGFGQFHDLAKRLTEMPEYSGSDFSWGDKFIDDCANHRSGTGNASTWRQVGTSHHLALVVDQIARLSAS